MEADDFAAVDLESVAGLAVHEGPVPEAAHEHVVRRFRPEVHQSVRVEEDVVEHEDFLPVRGTVIVRGRGVDEEVPVQAEFLLDVLAVVRVVPVDARVAEEDPVLERAAGFDRVLGEAGDAVEVVVEPDAVPVHRRGVRGAVREVHEDGGFLRDPDEGSRVLAVEGEHGESAAVDFPPDDGRIEVERAPVGEIDELAGGGLGERLPRGQVGRAAEARGAGARLEVHHAGQHGDAGVRGRRVPARRGPVGRPPRRRGREGQEVVRLHEGGWRAPSQHEGSLARLHIGRRLRADHHEELVERDAPQRVFAVVDRTQRHHGSQFERGRPRHVDRERPQASGRRKALDVRGQRADMVPGRRDRDPERRRDPPEFDEPLRVAAARRGVEADAMEVGRDPPRARIRERPGGPGGASFRATGFAGSAGARKLALHAGRRREQAEHAGRQRRRRAPDQDAHAAEQSPEHAAAPLPGDRLSRPADRRPG